MYCPNCGSKILCTDAFCGSCGGTLDRQKNLIQAALENDQAAYTELYRQAEKPVHMTIYSIVSPDGRNNPDADDIMVETMVKGFKNLHQLADPNRFVPWMRMIARNRSIDYLRKNKEVLFSDLGSDDDDVEFEDTLVSEDASGSPELSLDRNSKAQMLKEILSSVPAEQRTVLIMYYYHQMKIREIAVELGCTEATVKSRLKYGKNKVETSVRDLERTQGIKLHSFSPAALLLLLFRSGEDASVGAAPLCGRVLKGLSVSAAKGAAGSAAATKAGTTVGGAIKAAVAGLGVKATACIAAAAVLVSGLGIHFATKNKDKDTGSASGYAATAEIKAAAIADQKVQICGEVFEMPIKVGDLVDKTGAQLLTTMDEAKAAVAADPYLTELSAVFDTAMLMGDTGATGIDSQAESSFSLFRLPNGEYICVWMSDEGNGTEPIRDMVITWLQTGATDAVYIAGGIHAGMTCDEVSTIMAGLGGRTDWFSSEGDYKTSLELMSEQANQDHFTLHADVDNETVYAVWVKYRE